MIRHCFHLNEGIAVGSANFSDYLFDSILNFAIDHLATVLRAKNDVIVDIIDAVVYFSFHATIIALERVFVNVLVALIGRRPFHPTGLSRGFSGAKFYKEDAGGTYPGAGIPGIISEAGGPN